MAKNILREEGMSPDEFRERESVVTFVLSALKTDEAVTLDMLWERLFADIKGLEEWGKTPFGQLLVKLVRTGFLETDPPAPRSFKECRYRLSYHGLFFLQTQRPESQDFPELDHLRAMLKGGSA